MANFKATYKDARGQNRIVRLEAIDEASAKRSLRRRGILTTQLIREEQASGGKMAAGRMP